MGIDSRKAEAIIEFIGRDKVNGLIDAIQGKTDAVGHKTKAAAGAVDQMRGSWALMATGVNSALGIIGQVGSMVRGVVDMMTDAAQENAIASAFERAFPAAEAFAAKLEEATGGQLNDEVYQQLALKAQQAGLAGEQTAQVMNLATKAANALGKDVGETASLMVDGIVRANDKSLKALGLNLDIKHAYAEHAKQLGVSVQSLTLAQKRTILLEEAAKAAGKAFGDVNISDSQIARVNQLKKRWDDFTDKAKEATLALADGGFWSDVGSNLSEVAIQAAAVLVPSVHLANLGRWVFGPSEEDVARWGEMRGHVAAIAGEMTAKIDDNKRAWDEWTAKQMKAVNWVNEHMKAVEHARLAELARVEAIRESIRASEKATLADIDHAFEVAHVAEQMKKGQVAASAWNDAMNKVAAANWSAVQSADILKDAFRALVGLKPLMETTGDFAGKAVDAAKAVADGAAKKPGHGGGGAKKIDANVEAEKAWAARLVQLKKDISATFVKSQKDADEAEYKAFIEGSKKQREAMDARAKAMEGAQDRLGEMVKNSSLTIRANLNQSNVSTLDAIGGFVESFQSEYNRINEIIELTNQAGGSMGAAWGQAAPGMISAIGMVSAAFAKDAQWKYGILALAEAGAAAASFATFDYMGGAMHTVAAVQYGLAAAMAGGGSSGAGAGARGGGGGRGAAPRTPSPGLGPQSRSEAPLPTIIMNFSGTIVGDDASAKRTLRKMVADAGRFMGPGAHAP